ncbi:MAG: SAM-dependent methyltransferase, partial [Candidatus Thiodiazotropha sp. (ex Lucinoma borealis)]|nr:SAM-dependent methyltransferase [Candidatus Thiodiazotropha sp. (ex Lucinoma borealis)]
MSDAKYFEMNRLGWDQRAKAHFESKFYDVEGFLAGHTSLREIDLHLDEGISKQPSSSDLDLYFTVD